jgi:hypothetical protein
LTCVGCSVLCPIFCPSGPCLILGLTTRIADPKLTGGGVAVAFRLEPAGKSAAVVAEALKSSTVVRQIWTGTLQGGAPLTRVFWDGKDSGGKFVDTGDYTIRVRGIGSLPHPLEAPVSIVRLGITEIEALDGAGGNDEWQMVYFLKGSSHAFFATPAIHEYLSKAESGEVSDLDLNNGNPRSVPAVHAATDSPPLEGSNYEDDSYNYPLCYLAGAQPRLEVTFGASATSTSGAAMSPGYPVSGFQIRTQARLRGAVLSSSGAISPGGKVVLNGPPLPSEVTRVDHSIRFRWQYRASGAATWTDILGAVQVPLRFYTLIGEPRFKVGASGTQYAGPWVEVAEYWYQWSRNLGIALSTEAACVEAHVRGFFGQNGGIPTAIEGMLYDAYPLGGDGGATHYHDWPTWDMDLSALLNSHANGVYFNCSDNMGATTTMLSMMGVKNVRALHLGSMTLKAIWGIGAPGYTTSLWGGGSHSFSYHHIVTRNGGVHAIDTCLQVDEDGNPSATPGVPGWNNDRAWSGPNGYESLAASNPVTRTLQALPGLD